MRSFISSVIDPYERPARLYPALLVIAPLATLLVCLYGIDHIFASSVLSVLGFSGVAYALGRIARDAGKRKQEGLFAKWGGAPTTQMLRHRDARLDAHTKGRFHAVLARGIGKAMPSAEAEHSDPTAADELYRAATVWLINQTRDTKAFPLVFKENVAFGFHRNAFGLRVPGMSVAVVCIIWTLHHANVLGFTAPYFTIDNALGMLVSTLVVMLVSGMMLLAWLFWFNESALKRVGFAYSERLLEGCDRLSPGMQSTKKTTASKHG